MKRWQIAILIFELALFAAILVLPQVALPDFTFHGGLRRWRRIPVSVDRRPAPAIAVDSSDPGLPDQVVQRSSEHTVSLSLRPRSIPGFRGYAF